MKHRPALNWLVPLIIVLTLISAGVGLFYRAGSGPFPFTTVHGESVQMSGQGIYFYDTLFTASLSWGTDLVTLLVCLPLLALSAWFTRRGSLRAWHPPDRCPGVFALLRRLFGVGHSI